MGQVDGDPIFTIDFDFVDHQLLVATVDDRAMSFPLYGQSVASFYRNTLDALDALDVRVDIDIPRPFGLPDAARPFAEDTEHAAYDPIQANRYWQTDPMVSADDVAALQPGAVTLPGLGHNAHVEDPPAVLRVVEPLAGR